MQQTPETPEFSAIWIRVRSLLVFGAVTALAALLGSVATTGSVNSEWFRSLEKPSFYPPDEWFGIVWAGLYIIIAIAGWLAWGNGGGLRTLVPWTTQILLNLGWSVVFFGARQPGWALVVVIALGVTAIWTSVAMARFSRWAAILFIPYILWIGFATVLNAAIVSLG
jgi:benzodiazapine receptor